MRKNEKEYYVFFFIYMRGFCGPSCPEIDTNSI